MPRMEVDTSDLEKIKDALSRAERFFMSRDSMNAQIHLGEPRWSPITSLVMAEHERLARLLEEESA